MKENFSFDPQAWANMNNANSVQDDAQTNHASTLVKNAKASGPLGGERVKARAVA